MKSRDFVNKKFSLGSTKVDMGMGRMFGFAFAIGPTGAIMIFGVFYCYLDW